MNNGLYGWPVGTEQMLQSEGIDFYRKSASLVTTTVSVTAGTQTALALLPGDWDDLAVLDQGNPARIVLREGGRYRVSVSSFESGASSESTNERWVAVEQYSVDDDSLVGEFARDGSQELFSGAFQTAVNTGIVAAGNYLQVEYYWQGSGSRSVSALVVVELIR